MKIFAIDDEPLVLEKLHNAIAAAEPGAEILDFRECEKLLEAVKQQNTVPDIIFSDIMMPDMNGLQLADRVRQDVPDVCIVFVTDHPEFAYEAYKRHIEGYLLKPADSTAIRKEIDHLQGFPRIKQEKLHVRCFGNFEVFWQGQPLSFARCKTKEMFAYLVDRMGAVCSGGELCCILWEDSLDAKKAANYLRVLTNDLQKTLHCIGQEDVLIRNRNGWAVNVRKIDCDYYRMLSGNSVAQDAFQGLYMEQYSWAETTSGRLHFGKTENG